LDSETGVAWLDVIIYLKQVGQPLIEIWCLYLKRQGFIDISYTKKTHPILHWSITLHWNASPIEFVAKESYSRTKQNLT